MMIVALFLMVPAYKNRRIYPRTPSLSTTISFQVLGFGVVLAMSGALLTELLDTISPVSAWLLKEAWV